METLVNTAYHHACITAARALARAIGEGQNGKATLDKLATDFNLEHHHILEALNQLTKG